MSIKLKKLNDQVIVITGASSGIGLATAEKAAEGGAKIVLAARSINTLTDIAHRLNTNENVVVIEADVAHEAQTRRIADEALNRFGRIDTWINNAGISIYGRLDEVSNEDSMRLFATNFWGVVNGSLMALPHLRKNGGALINVGSEVSEAVVPYQGMYTASKHAVKGFTDALRVEVEEMDKAPVSITLIQPTAVNTPFPRHAKNYMDKEPKLPSPQLDPYQLAEAILDAARKPTRSHKVGTMAKLNTFVAKAMPGMGDKMSAMQAEKQKQSIPPQDREGALFNPSEDGDVYGPGAGV